MIRRLLLLSLVAVGLAPGTFVRTPVILGFDVPITLSVVDEPGENPPTGWTLEGVWEFKGRGLLFGGYSALLALEDGKMQAFSDRGGRFSFVQPDRDQGPAPLATRVLAEQPVNDIYQMVLFDIESAARDPRTGQYWLGFENTHAFQRYSASGDEEGLRIIHEEVEWAPNSGAEAMVRLSDGRFLVIPERIGQGDVTSALLYPRDPTNGEAPIEVLYTAPPGDFSVTDAAQLPDGRIALLLRRVVWGLPPFEARIALADWPGSGDGEAESLSLSPQIALDLSAVAPPENYEGLAVRERSDGALDLWVISDDNRGVTQRTLMVKLGFDPTFSSNAAAASKVEDKSQRHKKARE
ncbi:MAG: esterase-like activity of phytase family protein [Pseudomonadota bacterium]